MNCFIRSLLRGFAVLLLSMGVVWAEDAPTALAPQPTAVQQQDAILYVLNTSGPTLVAHNQDVTDNRNDLVSLPRTTYKRMNIAPGPTNSASRLSPGTSALPI